MSSSRIPDTHAEAWALLPWLANGRIAPEEREWVEAHVATCAECRAELSAQRMIAVEMVRAAAAPESAESDELKSFNKLWARIEAAESATFKSNPAASGERASESSTHAPRRPGARATRWLAAAVVVQAIGLGVLGMMTLRNEPDYSTVTRATDPLQAPAVRLVFEPQTSIGTVNMLLTHQGLQLVEGPGLQGNFTAVLTPEAVASGASADSVAAVMKKEPNVSFAEPVAR